MTTSTRKARSRSAPAAISRGLIGAVSEPLLAGLLVAAALVTFAQRREALNLSLPTVLATMVLACVPLGLYVLRG